MHRRKYKQTLASITKGFRIQTLFDTHLDEMNFLKSRNHLSPSQRALAWLRANESTSGGIRVHSESSAAYPEVTGYLIPTLLQFNEIEMAARWSRWLVSVQNQDGSWSDPSGRTPYTFDTGQVLKGLIAVLPCLPEVENAIRTGADWIVSQIKPSGEVVTPDKSAWGLPDGRVVSDDIHLYALGPLRRAGEILNETRYLGAVECALSFYLKKPDLLAFDTLSHFHAYVLEALVDLGRRDMAVRGMERVQQLQRKDGVVPAYPDVRWVCSPGLAQCAVVWYKLGQREPADKAMKYLCGCQNPSGGFYGSYGCGANYFPKQEISWAVKFFLDAFRLRGASFFE